MNRAHEILASLREEIGAVPAVELPAIIGQIEAVKAEAFAKLVTPAPAVAETRDDGDRLLTPEEAAEKLAQTSRWVREHSRELKARVDLPGRTLRFSEQRLDIYLRNRTRQRG